MLRAVSWSPPVSAATSVPPAHSAQLPACGLTYPSSGDSDSDCRCRWDTASAGGRWLEARPWRLGRAARRALLHMAPRGAHLCGAAAVQVAGGRRGHSSCLRGGTGILTHQRNGGELLVVSGMNSRHHDPASWPLTPHLGMSPPTDVHLPPGAGSPSARSVPFPFPLPLLTAHEAVHHPGLRVRCGWSAQILFYLISEKPKPTLTAGRIPVCVHALTRTHTLKCSHAHTQPNSSLGSLVPLASLACRQTAAVSQVGSSAP